MILYNHIYDEITNEIKIIPVEVKETEKLYKPERNHTRLGYYRKQINKNELNKLFTELGMISMVSDEEKPKYFKQLICSYQFEKVRMAEKRHEIEVSKLRRFEEIEIIKE